MKWNVAVKWSVAVKWNVAAVWLRRGLHWGEFVLRVALYVDGWDWVYRAGVFTGPATYADLLIHNRESWTCFI